MPSPTSSLIPINLLCDNRANPLAVASPNPRLSWTLHPLDPSARSLSQSACQILVSSTPAAVSADHADLWNSGRLASPSPRDHAYAGPPLAPSQQAWWKVRIWDQSGHPSPWSPPAHFTASLPSESHWHARWISAPASPTPFPSHPLPIFRRVFSLDRPLSRALAYVCGLGHFELRVNGAKAGHDLLEPAWSLYSKTCLYAVHDVTSLLRPDENVLAVLLGNGMYNVTGGRYAKFKASFGPPKLLLRLHLSFADGSTSAIVSDSSWRTSPGPITFSCIYGGEDHDARLESPGWDSAPNFDDSSWLPAAEVGGPGGTLTPQSSAPLRVTRTFSPVAQSTPSPGVTVFDLGQNFSGRPRLTIDAPAGTRVTLTPAEVLAPDGHISQKNSGSPVSFSYTSRGSGPESWHPRFSYTGFRYLQVSGPAPLELHGDFIHSSAPEVGHFRCSNDLLNRIHALILNAIRSNLHHVLTDCPHREKLGWLEQTYLMGPSIAWNFDLRTLYPKISADIRDAQRADGCVPTIAPQYTSFKAPWDIFNDSPEWSAATVLNPWLLFVRYGDTQTLADNYPAMCRYADYLLSRRNPADLLDYGLGDWYDIGPGDPGFAKLTSKRLTASATLYAVLATLARTAHLLGHAADASRFESLAADTARAFNTHLLDPSTGLYDTASQAACAMPLALGLADASRRPALLERLVSDIRSHDNHITAGDIGFRYVLDALAAAGRSDVIFDLLTRTDPPSYGSQLARGATSLTEAWDANPKVSQNHLMLGHAENWFYESLAGLRLDLSKSGPEQITLRPTPVGDVTWAGARHDSALGPISIRWDLDATTFRLTASIPPGASATLHLPNSDASPIILDSGCYHFTSPCS